jgi:SnoaL-like domain
MYGGRQQACAMTSSHAIHSPDPSSSYRAIENLIATYAELVDDGDFAGLGTLLAEATFTGSGAPVSSSEAIEKMFRDMLIVYDDGTPRTKHVTTNIAIEADEEAGTAVSRVLHRAAGAARPTAAAHRQRPVPGPLPTLRRAVALCRAARPCRSRR